MAEGLGEQVHLLFYELGERPAGQVSEPTLGLETSFHGLDEMVFAIARLLRQSASAPNQPSENAWVVTAHKSGVRMCAVVSVLRESEGTWQGKVVFPGRKTPILLFRSVLELLELIREMIDIVDGESVRT